jgi:hypothetical protein
MHACMEGRTRPMKSKAIVLSRAGTSPFEAQGARGTNRWTKEEYEYRDVHA